MATITLKSGTLYSGPGMDYVVATTGVNGRSAELLWREGNYYYVRPNNMNVQGYISASAATTTMQMRTTPVVASTTAQRPSTAEME